MNTQFLNATLTLAVAVSLAACAGGNDGDSAADSAAAAGDTARVTAQDTGGMQGMGGMAGMSGMGGSMMEMHPHMQMMEKLSPDSMKAMLPAHRQMVANMLSQTTAEMRKMNMPADAAFKTLGDSLRQDLVRMPELSARELASVFPPHHERMMRYMKMHEQMMKDMKM